MNQKIINLILVFVLGLFSIGNSSAQNIEQVEFDAIVVPQYMGSGTSSRLTTSFYAKVSGLVPFSSYKYYVTFVESSDFGSTSTGVGNTLFHDSSNWRYVVNPSFSAGSHDTLYSGIGEIENWFTVVYTGNSRFTAGKKLYPLMVLEEIGGSDKKKLALSDSIQVLEFATGSGANDGTGIYGTSSTAGKDFVALYNTDDLNERPLAVTHIENDNITIPSSATFWKNNVEGKRGSWGAIIPNNLDSGIRTIELFKQDVSILGFLNESKTGKWDTTNTVNPSGGLSKPIYIDSMAAPLTLPKINFRGVFGNTNEQDSNYYLIIDKRFLADTAKIKISVIGGDATLGQDYRLDTSLVYNLKMGKQTVDTIVLKIVNDGLDEYDETALFRIKAVSNCQVEGNGLHSAKIVDNDTSVFSFGQTNYTVSENSRFVKIPIKKINGHANRTERIQIKLKSKGKYTFFPSEFNLGSKNDTTLVFSPGIQEDSGFVRLDIKDESFEDFDDTIDLVLRPIGGEVISKDSIVRVIVKNDDVIPVFTFEKAQVKVVEQEMTIKFKVIRTKKNNNASDVKLSFVQGLSTAARGWDFEFSPTSRILTFENSDPDTLEVSLKILDDQIYEKQERIFFKLDALNNSKVLPISNFEVLIDEDDHPRYTINQINSINNKGELDSIDVDALITGVVYGINTRPLGNPQGFQFTLRDMTGGIQVFSASGNFGYSVKEGDSITVKGVIGQYTGMAQIGFIDTIYYHGSNAQLKSPSLSNSLGENTESDLRLFQDVILVDETEWPLTPLATNTFKDVRFKNATKEFVLRVDSDSDIDGTLPPKGYFDLVGIGGQYDVVNPLDSHYYLQPRTLLDIKTRPQVIASFDRDSQQVKEFWSDSSELITVRVSNITKLTQMEVVVASGNAQKTFDYKFDTPYRMNFTPGDTAKSFKVKIVDNGTSQADKVLVLKLDNVPYGVLVDKESHKITIIDDETDDISEFEKSINLKVYPNPTNGLVKVSSTLRVKQLSVYDIQGKLQLNVVSDSLDLTSLPKGIYQIKISFEEGQHLMKKIVLD